MLADLALKNAGSELIGALAGRGLVVIYRHANRVGDQVHLCFIQRGRGEYACRDLTLVGSYDDLDTAVTIANIGYGISESGWELVKNLPGANLPLISQAIKEYEIDEKQRIRNTAIWRAPLKDDDKSNGERRVRAEEALRRSAEYLICFETSDGLVTIFHEKSKERVSAEPFHLRFIPRDADGLLNSRGTVMVGSYGELKTALQAATDKYGTGESGWQPITAGDLPKGGHGPPPFER